MGYQKACRNATNWASLNQVGLAIIISFLLWSSFLPFCVPCFLPSFLCPCWSNATQGHQKIWTSVHSAGQCTLHYCVCTASEYWIKGVTNLFIVGYSLFQHLFVKKTERNTLLSCLKNLPDMRGRISGPFWVLYSMMRNRSTWILFKFSLQGLQSDGGRSRRVTSGVFFV